MLRNDETPTVAAIATEDRGKCWINPQRSVSCYSPKNKGKNHYNHNTPSVPKDIVQFLRGIRYCGRLGNCCIIVYIIAFIIKPQPLITIFLGGGGGGQMLGYQYEVSPTVMQTTSWCGSELNCE